MNNLVSLLHPARPAARPDPAPKFPANVRRGAGAAPFSSLLERAARPAPASRRERAEPAGEPEVRGDERREAARKKNRSRERDELQSLAGAMAVNGSTVKPQEPAQPVPEVTADNPAEAVSTVSSEAATAATLTPETDSPTGVTASGVGNAGTTVAAAVDTAVDTAVDSGELIVDSLSTIPAPRPSTINYPPSTGIKAVDPIPPEDISQPSSAKQLMATTVANPITSPQVAKADEAAPEVSGESAVAVATVAGAIENPLSPGAVRRPAPSRSARDSGTEPLQKSRGIGSAKLGETMKTVIKKEDIAVPPGAGLQMLPGSPAVIPLRAGPPLSILPGEAQVAGSGGISPADAVNAISKVSLAPTRADLAGAGELLAARPATAMTRISDVISREVRMFRRGGDDLVEVVLTPDAKTQISLRLQWREGQVEVQARCDLGDHQALNGQWPQLQASLAQHGVRLSHLSERAPTGFTEFFNNPGFSQQSGGERSRPEREGGAEPLSPGAVPSVKSGPASRLERDGPRGNRRLESWA